MKKAKQFCKYGHDTFICGRTKQGHCKDCRKQYRLDNKESISKQKKEYISKNKEKISDQKKIYHKRVKHIRVIKAQEYQKLNRIKIRAYQKNYRILNREKMNRQARERRKIDANNIKRKDKEYKATPKYKQRQLVKYTTDIIFKLKMLLRCRLSVAIKNNQKTGSAVSDLGCSIPEFKQYIEAKFYSSMTWDNWGKVWQLDHIIPLWRFDLSDRIQFLKAANYTNMQPLTIEDHLKKTICETKERNKLKEK